MIYFLRHGSEHKVKIGFSGESASARRKYLQTGTPHALHILGTMLGDKQREKELHTRFAHLQIPTGGKDWFLLDADLEAFIQSNGALTREAEEKAGNMSSHMLIMSPEKATKWLDDFTYGKQRKIRAAHVNLLATEMRKGRFQPTSQVGRAILCGRPIMVNGYHTLHAIIESDRPQVINAVDHNVTTERQVAELYFTYDIHKKRTFGEIAVVCDALERTGLSSATQVTQVGVGVRFIDENFLVKSKKTLPLIDQVELTVEYGEAARRYFATISGAFKDIRKKLTRKATIAVALVTFRYAILEYGEEKVTDFWRQTSLDDGIRRDDPRKAAYHHLLTTKMPSGGGKIAGKVCDASYSSRYLANCWNAWVRGEKLSRTVVRKHRAPIRIPGTPFNGKA